MLCGLKLFSLCAIIPSYTKCKYTSFYSGVVRLNCLKHIHFIGYYLVHIKYTAQHIMLYLDWDYYFLSILKFCTKMTFHFMKCKTCSSYHIVRSFSLLHHFIFIDFVWDIMQYSSSNHIIIPLTSKMYPNKLRCHRLAEGHWRMTAVPCTIADINTDPKHVLGQCCLPVLIPSVTCSAFMLKSN